MDDDEDFWEQVAEPCGSIFEIDAEEIVEWPGDVRRKVPTVTLVCSRPWGHTPINLHSDGVTDWKGGRGVRSKAFWYIVLFLAFTAAVAIQCSQVSLPNR